MVAKVAFHWGVVPTLMKISKAKTIVGIILVKEGYYSSIIQDQLHHMPYNDNNYGPPNGNQ